MEDHWDIEVCGEDEFMLSNTVHALPLNDCNYSLKHDWPMDVSHENSPVD